VLFHFRVHADGRNTIFSLITITGAGVSSVAGCESVECLRHIFSDFQQLSESVVENIVM